MLLDEPTSGLDPGARLDFWQHLKTLRADEGITILFTTHLMEEAERCDHLVILSGGQVVADGTPAALKEKIGGDVIVIQTPDPESLRGLIGEQFACDPRVVDGTLRLERPRGYELAAKIMESYPQQIEAVSVGNRPWKMCLFTKTGHRFAEKGQQE